MNFFQHLFSDIGKIVIWYDRANNWGPGRIHIGSYWLWSRFGGNTNETISHTLGLEELLVLIDEVLEGLARGLTEEQIFSSIGDIVIDRKMLIGEFSSDLCDIFQPWHALRSINWDKKNAQKILRQYPDSRSLVERFLLSKGIKE